MELTVSLVETSLEAAKAHEAFLAAHGASGAVAAFTGVVRGHEGAVDHLYLDWYPGMSDASLRAIAKAGTERFAVAALMVLHRCGEVRAGEAVVFVAAAAAHRRAAFDAVDYVMDRLKSEAALWKRESGPGGSAWIEPTQGDAETLKRWS